MDVTVVILNEFKPSSLPHIEIFLFEKIFEAFMIREDSTFHPIKVVPPHFQGEYNRRQFKIMSRVIAFMLLELSRSVSNDFTPLH
ncbi:hypothetical protein HanLR1_Chr13g0497411 [Helianthus annuus]|nr:hypothetical protein HanHA89_Chr13g0527341 [Helianthus annuus]KAJ0664845.1 hypothetical protein HanLR1_Chr13g0497411 [Helianthus annuus]